MAHLTATEAAIAYAARSGTLIVTERIDQFGDDLWFIEDHTGLITVALTEDEARHVIHYAATMSQEAR